MHCLPSKYEPAVTDSGPRATWQRVMTSGFQALLRKDISLCHFGLPRFFKVLIEAYVTDKRTVAESVTGCLKTLVLECVAPALPASSELEPQIAKIIAEICGGLRYRFHEWYPQILTVITKVYESFGMHGHPVTAPITQTLAKMRASDGVSCAELIEQVIGSAISAMGPAAVLEVLPLGLISKEVQHEFPTAWLLPVLKANVSRSEIRFFTESMIPIAEHCLKVSETAISNGNEHVAAVYRTLHIQVWELLPPFCSHAIDVATHFKSIARLLGSVLQDRPHLRSVVCTALITLIRTADTPVEVETIARFAKNYLPILFTLYCSDDATDHEKSRCLATIEAYSPIASPELLLSLFEHVRSRVSGTDGGETALLLRGQHAMMDLTIAMVGCMDDVRPVIGVVLPLIQGNDATLQKKGYKALALICASERPAHRTFVRAEALRLQKLLESSMIEAGPATKQHRLTLISSLVRLLPPPNIKTFVPEIITEVILCTKEVKEKARDSAFVCLVEIGEAIISAEEAATSEGASITISDYFSIVIAGLAGSPHMISATVVSLSRMVYQFRDHMPSEQMSQVLEAACILLQCKSREVIKSVLGFIKVAIAVLPSTDFEIHLPLLVKGLITWSIPTFRQKTKMIVERLIRKFGFSTVDELTPSAHKKLLTNIRKTKEREKRKKADGKNADDHNIEVEGSSGGSARTHKPSYDQLMNDSETGSDADDEESEARRKVKGTSAATGRNIKRRPDIGNSSVVIQDGDESDDALDFLDPSAATKLRSTLPTKSKTRKEAKYPVTEDGKWLIEDPDAISPSTSGKHHVRTLVVDAEEKNMGKGRKRSADESEDESEDNMPPASRKTSSGHLGAKYRSKKGGGDVKVKGAPLPHAYVPFDMKQMNKRKRMKAIGEFKGLVKSVKKGGKRV